MVLSWLLNSLSKEIATSVIYTDSAHEVWQHLKQHLKERFSQVNAPTIYQIQREISSLTQEQLSVASYFTKLKGHWDEISIHKTPPTCSCGAMKKLIDYQQEDKVMHFLMGLNDSYSAIRGICEVTAFVPQFIEAAALLVKGKLNNKAIKYYDHDHRDRGKKAQGSRGDQPKCDHCGWVGHTIEKCYKIYGHPPGHRLHKESNMLPSSSQEVIASNDKQNKHPFTIEKCRQLLDMLHARQPMAYLEGTSQPGTNLSGTSLSLASFNNSAPWILDTGATDHMDQSLRTMIGAGKEMNGLYHFYLPKQTKSYSAALVSPFVLWHKRMGYLSNNHLNFLAKYVSDISISHPTHCDVCSCQANST
ncbi:uncharacterized protein LOC143849504 [Tasmannia lanceolata]|uniref:uncharacterized protein LOC143849504 n=1 Tax=Tasmannia lanceolata TaxID=3420 RepID=UPI004062F743